MARLYIGLTELHHRVDILPTWNFRLKDTRQAETRPELEFMASALLTVAAVPTAFTQCPTSVGTQAVFSSGGFDLALSATPGNSYMHFGPSGGMPITIPGITNANNLYIRAPGPISFYTT